MFIRDVLLKAYSVVNHTSVLESAWVRRQFTRTYFLYKRYIESPLPRLVRAHPELFRGGPVFDIGANIGFTTLLFAGAVARPHKVYAFEPDPDNLVTLKGVVGESSYRERVVPIHAAVGERDGVIELWRNPTSHADHRVLTPSLKAGLGSGAPEVVTVPLLSVDGFLSREPLDTTPCFIKICVQGYELPVCRGLQRLLEGGSELSLALPYAPKAMQVLGYDPADLIELFRANGFSFYSLSERGGPRPLPDPHRGLADLGGRYFVELLLSRRPLTLGESRSGLETRARPGVGSAGS